MVGRPLSLRKKAAGYSAATQAELSRKQMKGLDVARSFFEEWGLPYLKSEHPQMADRVAAVMCWGSESLRNDDELSRDHNWGPRFNLVLTGKDMVRHGRRLSRALSEAAPREWKGFRFRPGRNQGTNVPVSSINFWFKHYLGVAVPPTSDKAWFMRCMRTANRWEHNLYMVRHATVFHDPLGEFTSRRKLFHYYPEGAWMRRIIWETNNVWHFGQYNFLDRLAVRRDPVAIPVCLGQFAEAVMRLVLLLSQDYTPYWKWLAAEFRKDSAAQELDKSLRRLLETHDIRDQAGAVRSICGEIHSRLVAAFDVNPEPTEHPHPLLCARRELAVRVGEAWRPAGC